MDDSMRNTKLGAEERNDIRVNATVVGVRGGPEGMNCTVAGFGHGSKRKPLETAGFCSFSLLPIFNRVSGVPGARRF